MNLALIFSRNISLAVWVEHGLLDREKLIYREHLRQRTFERVYWLTYGHDDFKYQDMVPQGVTIVPMSRIFSFPWGGNLYSLFMPFMKRRILKQCHVYKTDQMDGCWTAVIAKKLYKKPLMVRTGFPLSLFMHRKGGWIKEKIALIMEKIAYSACDVATVSSQESKKFVAERYRLATDRIHLMYNYINIEVFSPRSGVRNETSLLFVGRLEPQKNLVNLVEAAAILGLDLDIYGLGAQEEILRNQADKLGVNLRLMGRIANNKLAEVYNSYRYFVLPSLYEGMPKTLLEAMACGCVCIGTDTMGTQEVVRDGENGFLAHGFAASDLVEATRRAQASDHELIRKNGVQTIAETFSLPMLQRREAEIFKGVIREDG